MAAVTVANRRETVWGNNRVILADITIANNGDTWTTGLKKVLQVSAEPTTNASFGLTKGTGTNSGVVTFVTGGALVVSAIAVGY